MKQNNKNRAKLIFLIYIVVIFTIFQSCVQTRTFYKEKPLAELPQSDYMGTFSAIYFLKAKTEISIDNDLSLRSVILNDSLIRVGVKKLKHPTTVIIDSITAYRLRKELIGIINYVKKNNTIGGLKEEAKFFSCCPNSYIKYKHFRKSRFKKSVKFK